MKRTAARLYQRSLRWYSREGAPGHRYLKRPFERAISAAVHLLARWTRTSFPQRAIGGWYWVDRFRFELMMGWFELESVVWCRRLIRRGMVAVDVGGHIGYYARLFSGLVGRDGRVLVFEPEADNFAVLERNLDAPRYGNARAFPCALGDQDGKASLFVSPGNSNHSLLRELTASTETRLVDLRSLDSVARELGLERIDFVKIDVEGAELRVLDGMGEVLARSPDLAMLVECNPQAQKAAGASAAQLIARLRGLGFDVRAILPDGDLGDIAEGQPEAYHEGIYVNLLCTKGASRALVAAKEKP
jgi:FkbM family methyltransferase